MNKRQHRAVVKAGRVRRRLARFLAWRCEPPACVCGVPVDQAVALLGLCESCVLGLV